MTDQEALDALTLQCVGHNIGLMHRLTGQRSFASLLEQARGETNWRRLRAYLGVFESYSLYLHIPQKVQTLAFLYELLMHREGDIRRQAAALLGSTRAMPRSARRTAARTPVSPRTWTSGSCICKGSSIPTTS